MNYKLHRVAPNSNRWERPSSGRLGGRSVGTYVQVNGFGHEDWNFNFNLASNGTMLGYTVARPSRNLVNQMFRVVLAIYDSEGWKVVGYYDGAEFRADTRDQPVPVLQQMALDVFELAETGSVSEKLKGKTLAELQIVLQEDFTHNCWVIPQDKVFVFKNPVNIPRDVFNPGRQRMTVSYNITKKQFLDIIRLGPHVQQHEFGRREPEGARKLALHKRRERSARLVSEFKSSLTSFECEVCDFDFEKSYGQVAKGFIECHHIIPVSSMRTGQTTGVKDLAAVCSNCHRMLHLSLPMPTIKELRKTVIKLRKL